MFDSFSHFVSFGTTDQQTLLAQQSQYDGLLVPGTVAAFQKQGTGGFVLTMSAGQAGKPYVIDPRTPLFQQPLPGAKKSHRYLAEELGDPGLIVTATPSPSDFDGARIQRLASAWLRFNGDFRSAASEKFSKYAKRLGEDVSQHEAKPPLFVLPPYFMARRIGDGWWDLTKRLHAACVSAAGHLDVVPVVAAKRAASLESLARDLGEERAVIWVSDLHELEASDEELAAYGKAIRALSDDGYELAALYGGFLSVLLSSVGLRGSSHGIGYGEHRSWIELPQSGPPPARYYALPLHRYIAQDVAERLSKADPQVVACGCDVCDGRSPLLLDYHDLMRHSVIARDQEIADWGGLELDSLIEQLEAEYLTSRSYLAAALDNDPSLPPSVGALADHLGKWLRMLEAL